MLHLAMVRSPFAHATITSIDVTEAKAAHQRRRRAHRRRPRRDPGRLHQRLADHPRPGHPAAPADRRATGSPSPARSSPSSWPARRPRPATPPSSSTSSTTSCPPCSTSRRPSGTRCSRTPTSAPTSRRCWIFDSAEAGTGGDVDEAIAKARTDGVVIEREYRQQRLIPAFMEPRSTVVDPTGEQITHVVGHPDPAHPALRDGRHHRRARVEDPRHRPRRRRRLRRQAPADPGGDDHLRRRPARCGKPVKYTETRSESPGQRPPRSRPVAEAHARRREGRHGHRPQGRADGRPRRLRRASSAAACRCSARSCSTPSTSSRPTTSTARRCSPTRPGPTPTAAPAGPRRRSASSG